MTEQGKSYDEVCNTGQEPPEEIVWEAEDAQERPAANSCRAFLEWYRQLNKRAPQDPLYALPRALIEAIGKRTEGFFTEKELTFERKLCEFCDTYHAVGITDGRLIYSMLLRPPDLPTLTDEDIEFLGMDQTAQDKLETAEERIEPLRELARGYAGWLLTNRLFLQERDALRRHRGSEELALPPVQIPGTGGDEVDNQREHQTSGQRDNTPLIQFLRRWQLTRLDSWELPAPHGPNLSGLRRPEPEGGSADTVHLDLPVTAQLSDRYRLQELITEARHEQTPEHLKEWCQVLDRNHELGVRRWCHVFFIQFYYHLVLHQRYADRFTGRIQALDEVMGKFLHRDVDSVKKLRTFIKRRFESKLT